MKQVIKIKFLVVLLGISGFAFAQKGTIRGQIIDDETGEPLFSANAVIKGTQNGATSDFDGYFEIRADQGKHNVDVSFIGMSSTTITDVKVTPGEVTALGTIRLKPSSNELDAVTITAEAARNTEAAMITVKKKAANVMDGISSAKLKKTGDSDVGEAAKRVTGVSVEGGKYVYVRGLGDRYTKTTLNGIDIPGLDPDKNSIQIDIFPTNLIENMTILKSSLAELPADFTGGIVNIETKEFPVKKIFTVSGGLGYNPSMHFNDEYISYEGSKTDFLGFDGGARALPSQARGRVPTPFNSASDAQVNSFLNDFNPELGATQSTSFMDFSIGVSLGDQISLKNDMKLGYIFSTTYKNSRNFYDEVEFGDYFNPEGEDEYELVYATTQKGKLSENNVLLGTLGGLALKGLNSKYRLTVMHLQNGESRAAQLDEDNNGSSAAGQSGYIAYANNLEYTERSLTNVLLNGEHFFDDGAWQIDWRLSPTLSRMDEPDIRKTSYTINGGDSTFSPGNGGNPLRIWRYLDEINAVGKVDITREYELFTRDAKLKFGASHVYKQRDFEVLRFDLQKTTSFPDFSGDPAEVLTDENLYPNGPLYYSASQKQGSPNPNAYSSNVHNTGIYVSNEFEPFFRLKTIVGLRAENYVQRHTGRDVAYANSLDDEQGNNLDNEKVLDAFDLFPSANLIYSLNENQNLRASYSRSIARPSFKELSFAQILDPVSNRIFNGGFFAYKNSDGEVVWDGNLTETRINNIDLRWELFMEPGEIISASVFYKTFDDPIELVRIPAGATSAEFQPRNVGDGEVYGLEVEVRKGLGMISPALSKFNISGNFTAVESRIQMTSTEFEARKRNEKVGQNVDNIRAMAGQAPYIINAGFGYEDRESGLNTSVFYNVKGRTLFVVGGGLFPDVYSEPFHSLNVTFNKTFGEQDQMAVSFKASNLLNDLKENFYTGFRAMDQVYSRKAPGTTLSVGFSYNFN